MKFILPGVKEIVRTFGIWN